MPTHRVFKGGFGEAGPDGTRNGWLRVETEAVRADQVRRRSPHPRQWVKVAINSVTTEPHAKRESGGGEAPLVFAGIIGGVAVDGEVYQSGESNRIGYVTTDLREGQNPLDLEVARILPEPRSPLNRPIPDPLVT